MINGSTQPILDSYYVIRIAQLRYEKCPPSLIKNILSLELNEKEIRKHLSKIVAENRGYTPPITLLKTKKKSGVYPKNNFLKERLNKLMTEKHLQPQQAPEFLPHKHSYEIMFEDQYRVYHLVRSITKFENQDANAIACWQSSGYSIKEIAESFRCSETLVKRFLDGDDIAAEIRKFYFEGYTIKQLSKKYQWTEYHIDSYLRDYDEIPDKCRQLYMEGFTIRQLSKILEREEKFVHGLLSMPFFQKVEYRLKAPKGYSKIDLPEEKIYKLTMFEKMDIKAGGNTPYGCYLNINVGRGRVKSIRSIYQPRKFQSQVGSNIEVG